MCVGRAPLPCLSPSYAPFAFKAGLPRCLPRSLLVLHFFDFAGDLCAVICELSSYPSKMNENRHSGMHSGGAPRGDWGDAKAVTGIPLGNTPPRPKSQIGGLKSPHGPKSPVAELGLA